MSLNLFDRKTSTLSRLRRLSHLPTNAFNSASDKTRSRGTRAVIAGTARTTLSTIVIDAAFADRDNGFKSIATTTFPIRRNASHRSPSSNGTTTTSAEKIPSRSHNPRSDSNPGICAVG